MYDGIVCQAAELGYVNTTRYTRPAVAQTGSRISWNYTQQYQITIELSK